MVGKVQEWLCIWNWIHRRNWRCSQERFLPDGPDTVEELLDRHLVKNKNKNEFANRRQLTSTRREALSLYRDIVWNQYAWNETHQQSEATHHHHECRTDKINTTLPGIGYAKSVTEYASFANSSKNWNRIRSSMEPDTLFNGTEYTVRISSSTAASSFRHLHPVASHHQASSSSSTSPNLQQTHQNLKETLDEDFHSCSLSTKRLAQMKNCPEILQTV